MEIEIKAEDINGMLKEAIIKSAFGSTIEKALTRAFNAYDNPVDKEMKILISEMTRELLRDKYKPQILASLTSYVEKAVTAEVLEKITKDVVTKMIRAADDNY